MQRVTLHPPGARPRHAGAGASLWVLARLVCLLAVPLRAEDPPHKLESQVKAAFIVKFASFIEWPASAVAETNAPFVIGILGADPFGKSFDEAVKVERIKGRRIEVRRVHQVEKLADCQMVFVGGSELDRLEEIVRHFDDRPVLVITDAPGAVQRGSMVNFFKDAGKVRFEFNVAAAERARLRLSAKLLQVGKVVVPGKSEGRLGS